MNTLTLRFAQSPGDVLMGTAAVRDLHAAHPGKFYTGIVSSCPDLWLYNPNDRPVNGEMIEMEYPLINGCNGRNLHFVNGYRMFLEERLGLEIPQGPMRGDLHFSGAELAQPPLVNPPYWIINSGGKNDFTCKQWPHARWQTVVDHFEGRVQFVQVGELSPGHSHPALNGVVDLRGKTTIRELMHLTLHAQGVACGVTMLMHLSAALPLLDGRVRPCVVVAAGREPPTWEQYDGHAFIHNVGQLPCNERLGVPGGCWRSRVEPLGDGTWHDNTDRICVRPVQANGALVPECMALIGVEQVVQAIEKYLEEFR